MRIIYLSSLYPPHNGGVEVVAEMLALSMSKKGHIVEVWTSNVSAKRGSSIVSDNFVVRRFSAIPKIKPPLMFLLPIRLLRARNADIFHVHIAQAFIPEVVCLTSIILRKPYIAHLHTDLSPSSKAGFLLKIYKPLVLSRVLRRASSVVVFSEDQKMNIHAKYELPLSKIFVLPNGVDEKFYHNKNRKIHNTPKILFVGRLGKEKNITQLLKALDGISDKFKTDIVGDGVQLVDLKKITNDLKLQNVTFHGQVKGNKLLDFYREADIFILLSEHEGMPLVLLEAMAMGLPLIGTDVSGINNVIKPGKNGFLIPLYDSNKLQEVLLKLSSDSELYQRMSRFSYKESKQYSWDKITLSFVRLYEEIKT